MGSWDWLMVQGSNHHKLVGMSQYLGWAASYKPSVVLQGSI
jgi:hypothetical protein